MNSIYKFILIFILSLPVIISGQENILFRFPISDFFIDDYENLYLKNDDNLLLSKIDSKGVEMGRLQLTIPFKIQPITNPMQVVLFSEQAQEIKILDQYLTEIQKIDLRQLGNIQAAYLEDQQIIWLVDSSNNRLIKYNYRQEKIVSTTTSFIGFDGIRDVFFLNNYIYTIRENTFEMYTVNMKKIFSRQLSTPYRLRRNNDDIIVFDSEGIWKYNSNELILNKKQEKNTLVDINNKGYYIISNGVLTIEKQ